MQRIPEPELMNDRMQAEAYAAANFDEAHRNIVEAFDSVFPGVALQGKILDLGCGPGDIAFRFAYRFRKCSVIGVDGSLEMIKLANVRKDREPGTGNRISFVEGFIPGAPIPDGPYTAIVSNSLLHHLHHPDVLWQTIKQYSIPGTKIFIADLYRPASKKDARQLVETYTEGEPDILRRDFYHSLLAAFEPEEIEQQLIDAGLLDLTVKKISDRHLVVFGERG
jgi:SAM-dependent methyltransferase